MKTTDLVAIQYPRITRLLETKPTNSPAQITLRAAYKRLLRILPAALICLMTLAFAQSVRAEETNRYSVVARKLVDLFNAGDYAGIQTNLNKEMDAALPLDKSSEFFKGLTEQIGKIQKLGEPRPDGEAMVFPAKCEKGALDMQIALDSRGLIAG